jgi:predicted ATPase
MPESEQAPQADIRTPDQRLRVFVSSTLGDLTPEREAARSAIEQLRLAPVMFDAGARPHPAQDLYRAYLDQSDVFVGIYWQRYGWVGPDMTVSGLEDEYQRSAGLPRLVYVKRPAPGMEPGLRRMLGQLRAEGRSSYKPFADAAQLHDLLLDDLATLLAERFASDELEGAGSAAPVPATKLIGRDHDVRELSRLVRAQRHRLVVLTGAGGIGKTRLALAVLERTRRHWPDGAAFVDLSPVSDAQTVPEVIASGLGFVGQGNETPVETLTRRLAGRHMLLVIDNFEQVLAAAPVVSQLLERSPGLHVLVTSRVVLRLRGEKEWRVEPLRVSPSESGLAALASTPAVQMIIERVRDVRTGFELTDGNAAAVAELCRRLDGLPLALELAASWMRLLTPEQVLERLDQRMDRPGGGLSDLPGRQRTLRATLDWSYELLPESARQTLARLSVFAAPFTAEAAEALCQRDGGDAAEDLATLLDHSMITPAERADGQPAFRLLEMIRDFAAERLDDPGEVLGRLERHMLGVLAAASPELGSQEGARRLLDSEQPNLAVALRWVAQQPVADQILRRLGDVWVWSLVRGNLRRSSRLRQQVDAWPTAALRSERDQMARYFLVMIGTNGDGQWAELGALLDRILPDARRIEEPSRWSMMLVCRALARPYAPDSPAGAELAEAVAVTRALERPLLSGYAESHYGNYLCAHGDPDAAREMHEACLRTADARGDDNLRAEALYFLAMDNLAVGDPDPAHRHLETAARYYTDIDHRDGLTRCLGMLSSLALSRGDPRLAARLAGATAAARDDIGLVPWPNVAEAERRVKLRIQDLLPAGEYAAETASGRAVSLEIAIVGALASLAAAPRVTAAGL